MKLKLTFPPSYYTSNEKILVIKTMRNLFGLGLSEAKAFSEMYGQSSIFTVRPIENLNDEQQQQIDEHIRILRNSDVLVEEVLDGFRRQLKQLAIDAIHQDEFQLAIDLITMYRNNFK